MKKIFLKNKHDISDKKLCHNDKKGTGNLYRLEKKQKMAKKKNEVMNRP